MSQSIQFRLHVDVEDAGLGVPLLRVGEALQGTLEADGDLQGLQLELLWQGHGKGSPETHVVETVTAGPPSSGPWSTSFTFRIPDPGPLSYDGENVKVSWFLRAKAHGPSEREEQKFPLLVMPRSEEGAGQAPDTYRHTSDTSGAWFFLLFGAIFGGVPFFLSLAFFAAGEYVPLFFLPIFMLVGGALFVWGVIQWMSARLFQEHYLELPREDTYLGERVPFTVGGVARTPFRLDKLVLKHGCTESATRRRGTDSTTYSRQVFEQEIVLAPAREFRAGEAFAFQGEFVMPEDAPASLNGTHNDLTWKFQASFDVPSWPDPDLTWTVTMRPVLAAEVFERDQSAAG